MLNPDLPRPYRLNLGCGSRFDASWVNIDMVATGEGVIAHDISTGIPLPDQSCEVVYHSHVLEHIPRADAPAFLQECFRVLIPGGIIRIAVPDLERIVRTYLEKMEKAVAGNADAADDYDWIMLELYDQAVRNKSGGGMRDYIAEGELRNEPFVLERIGDEGRGLIRALRGTPVRVATVRRPLSARIRNIPGRLAQIFRRIVFRLLLGRKAAKAFSVGSMRLSGEIHQWMYDRYSLSRLLASVGFRDARVTGAGESRIEGWSRLHLDTNTSGQAVKPDSLFMEAVRPL
jgi:SAM-dependent methyltransferase